MKKKLFMLLLAIVAVVCVFVSCGDEEGEGTTNPSVNNGTTTSSVISGGNTNCAHNFKVTSTVAATCAADGKEISTCTKCGATSEKVLSKTNDHTMKYEETNPTCSAPGKVIGVCEVCEYTTEQDGKPALGHSGKTLVTEVVTAPTCTEAGTQKQVCSDCGEDQWSAGFKSEIPALGHSYERGDDLFSEAAGVTFVSGSCGIEGYFQRVCTDCGYDKEPITRDMYKNYEGKPGYDATKYDDMEAWEHSYKTQPNSTIPPTCTEPGFQVFNCVVCQAEKQVPQGKANGHIYETEAGEEGKHFITNPMPTCMTPGKRTYICTVCNVPADDVTYIVDVPTIPHDTSKHTDAYLKLTVNATCTESAYKVYGCCNGDCDTIETVPEGEPLGHLWERHGEVNCSTGGLTPYRCSRCKEDKLEKDEYSVENAKHLFGSQASDPTCINNAIYICASCNNEYGPDEGDSEDYDYSDGYAHGRHHLVFKETVAPTCSSIGYGLYKCDSDSECTVEGKNKDVNKLDTPIPSDVTPRLSHDFVKESGMVAITPDGKVTCKNCSLEYRDVRTEMTTDSKGLCLGECVDTCTCELVVSWVGYVKPQGVDILNANEKFEKSSTTWSNGTVVPLALGNGLIVLTGTDETSYTVEIYDNAGAVVTTLELEGASVYLDLYEYPEVSKVCVTSTTKGTVRFCQLAE